MPRLNDYRTKDMYIASYLSLSEKLIRLEPDSGHFVFVFDNSTSCEEKVNKYWLGEAMVDVKSYVSALKNIKTRVFAERG